jgi:DNA-binding response OmpR family regulator
MKAGTKVLIVDDEVRWRNLLKQFLRNEYEVEDTDNFGLREKIEDSSYDFVLLDIMMPGKDGIEVFKELREVDQHCVVIVLSVLTQDSTQVQWFRSNNVQVFSKSEDRYIDKVRAYIKSYQFKNPEDLSVLIVDDEERKQNIYRALLAKIGINDIEAYQSLEEAEQRVTERDFDVYIIDICFREEGVGLVAKGQRLVALLLEQWPAANRIIIPITTEEVARDVLAELADRTNVRPLFLEQQLQFTTSIEFIVKRGPFMVQMLNG